MTVTKKRRIGCRATVPVDKLGIYQARNRKKILIHTLGPENAAGRLWSERQSPNQLWRRDGLCCGPLQLDLVHFYGVDL